MKKIKEILIPQSLRNLLQKVKENNSLMSILSGTKFLILIVSVIIFMIVEIFLMGHLFYNHTRIFNIIMISTVIIFLISLFGGLTSELDDS